MINNKPNRNECKKSGNQYRITFTEYFNEWRVLRVIHTQSLKGGLETVPQVKRQRNLSNNINAHN